MPLISTVIARFLAFQDWCLAQWVDIAVFNTTTSCYAASQISANVNQCGQEYLRLQLLEEWIELSAKIVVLIPAVVGVH